MLVPVIILLAILVLAFKGLGNDPTILPTVLENKPLPAFQAVSLTEPSRQLTQADIKGPALLNVWATWCPTCAEEHHMLNQLARSGITIYGINYKEEKREHALAWLAQRGDPYVFNVDDIKGQIGIDFGVYGAPETFFIDHKGTIRHRHVGAITQDNWDTTLKPIYHSLQGE